MTFTCTITIAWRPTPPPDPATWEALDARHAAELDAAHAAWEHHRDPGRLRADLARANHRWADGARELPGELAPF